MTSTEFDIPEIPYFRSKNIFSGSMKEFSYKIIPEGETIKVAVWVGVYCYEKSNDILTKTFPLDQKGRIDMLHWLEEQRLNLISDQ